MNNATSTVNKTTKKNEKKKFKPNQTTEVVEAMRSNSRKMRIINNDLKNNEQISMSCYREPSEDIKFMIEKNQSLKTLIPNHSREGNGDP